MPGKGRNGCGVFRGFFDEPDRLVDTRLCEKGCMNKAGRIRAKYYDEGLVRRMCRISAVLSPHREDLIFVW